MYCSVWGWTRSAMGWFKGGVRGAGGATGWGWQVGWRVGGG
jgi:hypothetical protein